MAPSFEKAYTYLLFKQHEVIDLRHFGIKSDSSTTQFYLVSDDGQSTKLIKDSKLTIDVPEGTVPGGLAKVIKVLVMVDVFEETFTVNFQYESFARIAYNVPGNDGFNATKGGSSRSRALKGVFVVGRFWHASDSPLLAYNASVNSSNEVDSIYLSPATKLYPVLSFLTDNLGTVQVDDHSFPLSANVISDDKVIPLKADFVKLNNCSEVVVE